MTDKDKVMWAYDDNGDFLGMGIYKGEEFYVQTKYDGPSVAEDGKHRMWWQVYVNVQDDMFVPCMQHFIDPQWFERTKDLAAVDVVVAACWERRQEKGYSKPAGEEWTEWVNPQVRQNLKGVKSRIMKQTAEKALGPWGGTYIDGSSLKPKGEQEKQVRMTISIDLDEVHDRLVSLPLSTLLDLIIDMVCSINDDAFTARVVKRLSNSTSKEGTKAALAGVEFMRAILSDEDIAFVKYTL